MARQSRIEINLERELAREREFNAFLQRDIEERRASTLEANESTGTSIGTAYIDVKPRISDDLGEIVHEDKIVFSPEAKTAVLAVAIRLEERADKRALPNGAALCHIEELYERSGNLKDLLGPVTNEDEEAAQELLAELIGSR